MTGIGWTGAEGERRRAGAESNESVLFSMSTSLGEICTGGHPLPHNESKIVFEQKFD